MFDDIAVKQARRFWENVDKSGDCWVWTGGKIGGQFPYGIFNRGSDFTPERITAHRMSWYLHCGSDIPEGLCVLHRCDNPVCVRPEHLFLGTRADNMRDMDMKGRRKQGRVHTGENHWNSRLKKDHVLEIKKRLLACVPQRQIAMEYGVSQGTIQDIHKGRTWRHVV